MAAGLTRAVVLAAGRGTRMSAAAKVSVRDDQAREAARGLKPLIPFRGAPFISYVLASLADAGYRDVCIVVRSLDDPLKAYLDGVNPERIALRFAIQHEPLGTADALLAAESFARMGDFALVNADNLYPAEALGALRKLDGPGLVAFGRAGLLRGNVTPDRLAGYAVVTTPPDDDTLTDIVEKPSPAEVERLGNDAWFSMTCWRFAPGIIDACRAISPSARGELELPDAVRHSIRERGERFAVARTQAPVLDLSRRDDIASVERMLHGRSTRF